MAKITSPEDRLGKLLALAEGEGAEAELAMERAIMFAASNNIDLAVARARQKGQVRAKPEKRRTKVGTPGKNGNAALMDLFISIANANDLRCAISGEYYTRGQDFTRTRVDMWGDEHYEYVSGSRIAPSIFCHAYGFPSDHDVTAALYAVASVQMVTGATKAIKNGEHKVRRMSAKTYRTEFYIGFIGRLKGRLWDAKRAAEKAAGVVDEVTGTGLVLADKKAEVDDLYREENKHFYRADGKEKRNVATFKGAQSNEYDHAARSHGQRAADEVNLSGGGRDLASAQRGAISGN